ncbi:helicase-exonuclease AddAB subunit AddA [Schleiferilactobacillus shenzhenensis]|uniref:ATP-dependent helicase/nuclease subunit A n=1 Tax=Schleiferilactobacillus shenzhenensis LY-73 TaxID=1231336 RepID=U4TTC6_9LACO|nr:helicase-exonuclease AddAB subunit AddA [Schleiferilactobacillus shenzhenensis]ERL66670.1 AddA [Schleiferilactobacillus shenzhenensis LY-73]
MSNTKFTASQQAAVDHAGHNILVSASAGSGKTTVLVERVIQKLLHGESIDRLLIVTFTQAAAAEMRDRIRAALAKAAETESDDLRKTHLRKQQALLGSADIATLDAFCARVVRRFYYVIDYDPAVRTLGDDNERQLLWNQVWEQVRDHYYDEKDAAFLDLVTNFSGSRDDEGLTGLVQSLYTKAMASPDPAAWIKAVPRLYDFPLTAAGVNGAAWFAPDEPNNLRGILVQTYSDLFTQYRDQVEALSTVTDLDKLYTFGAKQLPVLAAQLPILKSGDWDAVRGALKAAQDVMAARFPSYRQNSLEPDLWTLKTQVQNARNALKEAIASYVSGPFLLPLAEWLPLLGRGQALTRKLSEVLGAFADALTQVKQRRGLAEFADIELAALRILTAKTATDIEPKTFYAEKYHEIMVDEYQDTNPLQEAILTTIAHDHPGNMFMVGDIKQSIYGFRQADPSLFASKYTHYQPASQRTADADDERIVLAENFRSTEAVDDMVNYVFQQLMDPTVGDVAYDENARLQYGAAYYPPETGAEAAVLLVPDQAAADDDPDAVPLTGIQAQTAVVAEKIKALVAAQTPIYDKAAQGTRPMTYADAALIVPTRGDNLDILDTLTDHNVPVVMNDAKEYFQTTEITVMLNYLSLIDNPDQDIPLVGWLRSPIVGFSSDDLATIRLHHRQGPYHMAWAVYLADSSIHTPLHERAQHWAAQLDQYRTLSKQVRIADLIWRIYADTGFLDYAGGMPSGKQRQANLHALYERANDFEANGFRGIFNFIRFIRQVRANQDDMAISPVTSTDENAVTVMTIHGSKGLEFPVVFLLNAQHQFNPVDERAAAIALTRTGGVGVTIKDYSRHMTVPTPQHFYGQQIIHGTAQSEELRKLYVALTRARQSLYVVASIKDEDALGKAVTGWAGAIQPGEPLLATTARRSAKNILDLLMPTLLRLPTVNDALAASAAVSPEDQLGEPAITVAVCPPTAATPAATTAPNLGVRRQAFPEITAQAQAWHTPYRFAQATRTAAFQTVTEIKRAQDDPVLTDTRLTTTEASGYTQSPAFRYVKDDEFTPPKFLTQDQPPQSTTVGTATHLVFQEMDLSRGAITADQVAATIDRLQADGQIDAATAAQIDTAGVAAFYATPVGQQLLAQPTAVHREMPFALLLPPAEVFGETAAGIAFPADADILIHGIIDGYIALSDQVILFDYKTDHVRGRHDPQAYLADQYRLQLQYYGAALGAILHTPVTAQYVYSVELQKLIPVPVRKEE